ELRSPMICLYLLGLPDHYTNKQFATFYWKSFVSEARNYWTPEHEKKEPVKISLRKSKGNIVGVLPVEDYIHHPEELEGTTLYNWICSCKR
ncbi:hypothetical protein IW261DRAFT_1305239, partial [Armillaria novae-zelandiae]